MPFESVAEVVGTPLEYSRLAAKLTSEFDNLSRLIASGTSQFRGFAAAELSTLASVVEEKRAEFLAGGSTQLWIRYWQETGRVHGVFRSDARSRAVYQARLSRRPSGSPVRYMGFTDDGKWRTFRFSPLPETEVAGLCRIRVPVAFFGRDSLTLQEGPALCLTIMAELGERADYDATCEDVERFLNGQKRKPADMSARSPLLARLRVFAERNQAPAAAPVAAPVANDTL
jgi:hypothetical protein